MEKNKKKVIYYSTIIAVFLIGVFVVGPLIESYVINPMKPYITVYRSEYVAAMTTECKSCDLPPVMPIEMYGNIDTTEKTMNIPVDRIPVEYKPYVHYPDSWSEWWNPFQPNGIGPPLRIALNFIVPLCAVAVLIYGIIVWRRGGFKEFMRKLKP